MSGTSIHCAIDFTVDDAPAALIPFIERIAPVVGRPGRTPWRIDLAACQYLGPDAAAVLFASIVRARISGRDWSIVLPRAPAPLVGFCRFSALTQEVEGGPPPDQDHPANETLRLTRFMRNAWNLPDPLIRLVRRHVPLSTEGEDHLRTCIGEVLQNIEDHSRSPVGGVVCARYLSGPRQVRIAVVDKGLGILGTLKPRYPGLSGSMEALEKVVQGGFSARSLRRNAGVGLRNLATFATARGGTLAILTGDALIEIRPGQRTPRCRQIKADFEGTGVFFTLHVDTE